jgi:hypothetical protein
MSNEFDDLYPSLFDNAHQHIKIIRALAQKRKGMTRKALLESTGLPDGGAVTVHLIILLLLTVITQVGGLIYACCWPLFKHLNRRFSSPSTRFGAKICAFCAVYLLSVLIVLPLVAPLFGRVALPVAHSDLKPHHILTSALCRHFVKPKLRRVAEEVAVEMKQKHGSTLYYLDAQHPFFDGWPLVPHLSHSDGKKLDIALLWLDAKTGEPAQKTPSSIGYGVFEDPRPGENDRSAECEQKGFWQYSFMEKVVSQGEKQHFKLDEQRTAAMVRFFCQHHDVKKVLIEPYLKKRLGLQDLENLRHQGCNSVRHDDHIHVELK